MRCSVLKSVGFIPVVFFSNLGIYLSSGPVGNLVQQKICSPDGPPASVNTFICNNTQLVADAVDVTSTRNTIRTAAAACSSLVFGLFRDKTGRSAPLIFIGESAEFIGCLLYFIAAWNWTMSVWIPVIVESLIGGFFGSTIFNLGIDCFVISTTAPEERVIRIQYFAGATLVSILLASSMSGFIVTAVGYVWSYFISICVHILAIILMILLIDEQKNLARKEWSLSNCLKTIFKSKPNNAVFWMTLFSGQFLATLYSAEAVEDMYYQQQGFHFTVQESTIYGTFHFLIPVIGSVFAPIIFVKVFKFSDFTVGKISLSLTIIGSVATAFAQSVTALYLFVPLNIFKYIPNATTQSIFSRCIDDSELGMFLGFISIAGILLPFGINYLYKSVFNSTYQTMPGAFLFVTAAGCLIVLILFCISSCLYIEPKKEDDQETTDSIDRIVHSRSDEETSNKEA